VGALHREGFNVECKIVGTEIEPEYPALLQQIVAEERIESFVQFAGRLSDVELDAAYRDADAFVLPSEHDGSTFEGFGLVYLEALAYGVPTIGSLESGADDIIRDGENGFLVPPGDTTALVDAIRRILSDETLRSGMSAAAPASVERFSWEHAEEKMEQLYKSLV
jgi:glycosyltransferase involved in cell wall biosynthesis